MLSAAAVCCLLLLVAKKQILVPGMSQRVGYSALFTQLKFFHNVSNDKTIEHGRINSAFWESVWNFSQQKNAVQPTPVKMSQLTPKSPVFFHVETLYYVYLFPIPFITFALLFSLPPSRNSDPGSHSRVFSPLPTTVRASHFYREKTSALSSLVDSLRVELRLPTVCALSS